jgi:hypothetical protein
MGQNPFPTRHIEPLSLVLRNRDHTPRRQLANGHRQDLRHEQS